MSLGWSSIFPLVVHQPAFPSISTFTLAGSVHKYRGDNVVCMSVQLKRCVLQRGHSGDGCDLASTLCKYDLGKGDLFVLIWAMVIYLF